MNSTLQIVVIFALLGVPCVSSAGETERVSVASDGTEGNNDSYYPAISGNGRYVAFQSKANNLVANDIKIGRDIFVHDRQTETTELVSVDSEGNQAPAGGNGYDPSISADGRYVVFHFGSGRLAANDTNRYHDIYVRDRQTGTTELVSVATDGSPGNLSSSRPNISADGRHVVFISSASNLVVPNDTNNLLDVFVRDRVAGITQKVTVAFDGGQANQHTLAYPVISADGRYVAFNSAATNLVPDKWGNQNDVYVRDLKNGTTELVSVALDGTLGGAGHSYYPAISADGRYVAFRSTRVDLVPNDTTGGNDIFVRDRQERITERVSVASDGSEVTGKAYMAHTVISANGRYVAWYWRDWNQPTFDIAIHDRETRITDELLDATNGLIGSAAWPHLALNADGRYLAFSSDADHHVVNDTNGFYDVFVYGSDTDGDGVNDDNDNCTLIPNADQRDSDEDGYGNLCDGDLNNDGSTNTLDLNLYKLAHRSSLGHANYNVDADFNADGVINTLDLNIYKGLHRQPPGPSCCGLF